MIKLKDILNELEFNSQKEFDVYSKAHTLRPNTKVKIAGNNTTVAKANLRRGLPDKKSNISFDTEKTPKGKSLKNMKPDEIDKVNNQIYDVVSDWVVSSMSDTNKRQELIQRLDKMDIPIEYKQVDSDTLYRAKTKGSKENNQKYISYSADIAGAEKMKGWINKIFGTKSEDIEIVKRPTNTANIVISIPAFLRLSKKSSGKKFNSLWKTEKEVIVKA